jgi:hypothetical protein
LEPRARPRVARVKPVAAMPMSTIATSSSTMVKPARR